jgi:hypothetical protein
LTAALSRGARAVRARVGRRRHDDAGEIQGWVFVTLMTAGLVFAIWQVAQDRLTTLFEQAVSSVTGG